MLRLESRGFVWSRADLATAFGPRVIRADETTFIT